MKKISILGSTGSIGTSTLDVVRQNPEELQVVALACGRNIERVAEQIKEFQPQLVSVSSEVEAKQLKALVGSKVEIVYGESGSIAVATHPQAEPRREQHRNKRGQRCPRREGAPRKARRDAQDLQPAHPSRGVHRWTRVQRGLLRQLPARGAADDPPHLRDGLQQDGPQAGARLRPEGEDHLRHEQELHMPREPPTRTQEADR